ncbi:MAG: phosphatidate cytidylyltransferase [Gammaproteobacteria bacterium]|nr:phosphatidate cytidylyltransferase [Gammaproteobacteria bacterium]
MLKQRIITAVILAVLASLALFEASNQSWQWIVLGVGFIAAWEWAGFAQIEALWKKALYAGVTTLIGFYAVETLSDQNILMLTVLEALLLLSVVSRYQRTQGKVGTRSVGYVMLAGILSVVLFTTAFIHFRAEFSPQVVLMSLVVIWAIDTGAYFSGRKFGKTKLAVHVSPGKTWEGVWGGAALAFIISLIGLFLVQPELLFSEWIFALGLALVALFSVLGDLFESVLKRQAGLKDSGKILPGHGGVLDRIDSLLIAVPMLYLLWHFGAVA